MANSCPYWNCDDIKNEPDNRTLIQRMEHKNLFKKIKTRIHEIEEEFFNSQVIKIEGYSRYSLIPNTTFWKIEIERLFYQANINVHYILDMWQGEIVNNKPCDTIYISLISHRVKKYVYYALLYYFHFEANINVKITE